MGLLDRADAVGGRDDPEFGPGRDVAAAIDEFSLGNPSFHCVILERRGGSGGFSGEVAELVSGHGAACGDLPDGKCYALLPGDLDMELFSHRISQSSGSTVALQFSADSPSVAMDALRSHLS
jgi:hypothetical protein